jgi:predicted ATP-grasp superfamily ATP-dependent carboligase
MSEGFVGGKHASAQPVLVFGAWHTVLGAIRCLRRAGYAPLVATDPGQMVRRSRFFRAAPPSRHGADPQRDLAAYLKGLPFERAVLLPCSDEWTHAISRIPPELSDRFPASVAQPSVLERLVDKWHLAEAMRDAGLPHPRTVSLNASTNPADIPDEILCGAFIKPRDSSRFQREFGVKAFHVSSRVQLAERLAIIAPTGMKVELQEYIPGPASNHYFVDGFVDRMGRPTGLFARRRLRMYPADFGNSTFMESVPLTAVPDAVSVVTRLLKHVGYRGVFSAELKRDARDGGFRLIEVNARPWWYVEFAAQCGVDVCDMAVRDALGAAPLPAAAYATGKRSALPYYDYFAWRALHPGGLSLGRLAASWMFAKQPVFSWSDPWPGVAAISEVLGGWLVNRLRRSAGFTNASGRAAPRLTPMGGLTAEHSAGALIDFASASAPTP